MGNISNVSHSIATKDEMIKVKAGTLVILVDTTCDFGRSTTGKSIIVASTGGFVSLGQPNGMSFGLNVIKKS